MFALLKVYLLFQYVPIHFHNSAKDIPVYNITCPESKRTSWGEVLELGKELAYTYPFEAGVSRVKRPIVGAKYL